jgi:hypothetical protein
MFNFTAVSRIPTEALLGQARTQQPVSCELLTAIACRSKSLR